MEYLTFSVISFFFILDMSSSDTPLTIALSTVLFHSCRNHDGGCAAGLNDGGDESADQDSGQLVAGQNFQKVLQEGVRLPEQGGGRAHAGKKVPKDTYPTVPGKENNRMLRRIRPATPERKNIRRPRRIHPHPRREAGKQRTGRRGQGTAHLPGGTHPAAAQPDTAGKRQKNITELFAGFRKYSIFALAIPKWCVSSAG